MQSDYIDIYCERLEPGLFAEPLNAATNISFIIAAICALIYAQKHNSTDFGAAALIILLASIGAGSTLFHTFATSATMMMDVIPILIYQVVFIIIFARNVMSLSWAHVGALFAAFMISSFLADMIPTQYFNGSLSYAPSLIFLTGFAIWAFKNTACERVLLLCAALLFLISLIFRSVDMAVCENIAIGTHFLWHCCNGVVLYMTTRAYIAMRRRTADA